MCALSCVSVIDGTLGYLWLCVSSGLKCEHVFKMTARVSSTSSEEMASSSEDSASEDPNTNANMTIIKFVDIFKYCFVC